MITEKELKSKSDEELINLLNTHADKINSIKNKILELQKEFDFRESEYGKIVLFLNNKYNSKIKDS